jgi:two-component system, NtrC family, sensor kinase
MFNYIRRKQGILKHYLQWPNDHSLNRYRRTILDLNRSLTLIADPDSLMASIATRLKELFGTDRVIILHSFADSSIFSVAFSAGYDPEKLKSIRLSQQDRLAKWLSTNETTLIVQEGSGVLSYLSSAERALLAELDVRLCVPLLALNRLSGLMFLSSTQKDWSLSEDDLNLLQVLVAQASMAFENAYLSESQRDRLRRLYRAERLATAGQLAASVAHEIRNPLTAIRSTVQYLLGDYEEDNPKRALVEGVIAEVDRIDRTVDDLLNLTRRTEFKPEKIPLGGLIKQSLLLINLQAQEQLVHIEWTEPLPDLNVMADSSRLKQLFLNLMMNALQAMPQGGRLSIGMEIRSEPYGIMGEKKLVFVSITDTGCGIPAENFDKIFDPFFTTRQGGTGLGLPTCYAIVRQHGGEMEITSRVNEGTTVSVRLPLVN